MNDGNGRSGGGRGHWGDVGVYTVIVVRPLAGEVSALLPFCMCGSLPHRPSN